MHYFSASFIFPVYKSPVRDGILVTDDSGKILDLLDPSKDEIPSSIAVEKFDGIICPGFINTHCHLELSHLKGKFSQKKGLATFISEMVEKREASEDEILNAMQEADDEMFANGIVAVGDISNNSFSINTKRKSKISYHTFIELFDIFPDRAETVFEKGIAFRKEFENAGLFASLSPHAPYTVSARLFNLITDEAIKENGILTIHNQETEGENEMFEKGTGALLEKLKQLTGAYHNYSYSGKSSLLSYIENIPSQLTLQLVHNTFTVRKEVTGVMKENQRNLFWCLCPNANQFIENRIPDINMLMNEGCRLTVGTDSYASNNSLSILNEFKTINDFFPDIGLENLIQWATINAADFLRLNDNYGSFEKGKSPGINLITDLEFQGFRLKKSSRIKRLL